MEVRTKTIEVYVSSDGIEFQKKEDCEKYEKQLNCLRFFVINCQPDLTETGMFQHRIYVAISNDLGKISEEDCRSIVVNYAIKSFGYLGCGVMGVGFMKNFSIFPLNFKEFITCSSVRFKGSNLKSERLLLVSDDNTEYYDNFLLKDLDYNKFNYKKQWGFK